MRIEFERRKDAKEVTFWYVDTIIWRKHELFHFEYIILLLLPDGAKAYSITHAKRYYAALAKEIVLILP